MSPRPSNYPNGQFRYFTESVTPRGSIRVPFYCHLASIQLDRDALLKIRPSQPIGRLTTAALKAWTTTSSKSSRSSSLRSPESKPEPTFPGTWRSAFPPILASCLDSSLLGPCFGHPQRHFPRPGHLVHHLRHFRLLRRILRHKRRQRKRDRVAERDHLRLCPGLQVRHLQQLSGESVIPSSKNISSRKCLSQGIILFVGFSGELLWFIYFRLTGIEVNAYFLAFQRMRLQFIKSDTTLRFECLPWHTLIYLRDVNYWTTRVIFSEDVVCVSLCTRRSILWPGSRFLVWIDRIKKQRSTITKKYLNTILRHSY